MSDEPRSPAIAWGLNILHHAATHRSEAPEPLDRRWLRILGLTSGERGVHEETVRRAVKKAARRARREDDGVLFENLGTLGEALGLDALERDILAFAVLAHADPLLRDAFDQLSAEACARMFDLVAAAIGAEPRAVRAALRSSSALVASGVVRVGECGWYGHREPFTVDCRFAEVLRREHSSPPDLTRSFFRAAKPAQLGRDDYRHVSADVDVLTRLLRAASERRQPGVNILVYGRPGTGKTQLAKMLAREVEVDLVEVNAEDEDRDPITRHGRLAAYMLAQRLVARQSGARRSVVLFDELEDVFPRIESRERHEAASKDKAFTNRMLEDNPVPTIWVGNEIEHVDPAFLRRFDYVLELFTPPRRAREGIFGRYIGELPVSQAWISRAAADERLTPAHIERAVRVAKMTSPATESEAESTLTRTLDRSLALTSAGTRREPRQGAGRFELDLLHADVDLTRVVEGFVRSRAGTVCLYGPPGTGKTAFARHLAACLDMPLHVRCASDLLSPWLGSTEQNFAAAFRKATDERALLLLDEADSFLRSRSHAQHSWEITQVNELLVQMEAFSGVFVCATNLMDQLDEASLRRFDLKIRFSPPGAEQRWRLFEELAARVGASLGDTASVRMRVDRLAGLTPGDFAAVGRRLSLLGAPSADDMLRALAEETRGRAATSRDIGFRTA